MNSEIKTVNDASESLGKGLPIESRDRRIKGTWDGKTLRFTLPVDEWGIPELTDAHVKGIRELLSAFRSERMYLVKEKGLKFIDD